MFEYSVCYVDFLASLQNLKIIVFQLTSSRKKLNYINNFNILVHTGSWLLFWPCGWSIALSATAGELPDLKTLALFGCGALIMRGAGCTINDLWDKDIDAKVERTKNRPLVNKEINSLDAWIFLSAQLSVGLIILLQLNWLSILTGATSLGLVTIYPLMKRITYWPQFVLGMTFNYGALLGWCATQESINFAACLPLYVAGISWTIIYDTIYAHQVIYFRHYISPYHNM